MKQVCNFITGLLLVSLSSLNNGAYAMEVSKINLNDTIKHDRIQYFSTLNNASQLGNYKGTQFLEFEFPGKSAEVLYKSCIELFKDYTGKIELIKNRSVDLYNSLKVDYNVTIGYSNPMNVFYYNYLVTFEDGKVIIENPYIITEYQAINVNSGRVLSEYLSIGNYISYLDNTLTDKNNRRSQEREKLVNFLKSNIELGYNRLIDTLNCFTDSILKRAALGPSFNQLSWIADRYPPKFELSSDGLVSDSKREYIIIKTPDIDIESAKLKTNYLINFLHCDLPIEYYRSIIGNRIDFYSRRGISPFVLDAYFGQGTINFGEFFLKDDFGDFKKFKAKKTISAPKDSYGVAEFDFDITYASGYVKISVPRISNIMDGQYDWMNKINGYKCIFEKETNRVLRPEYKLAVESYFNELYEFLFKYYSEN